MYYRISMDMYWMTRDAYIYVVHDDLHLSRDDYKFSHRVHVHVYTVYMYMYMYVS